MDRNRFVEEDNNKSLRAKKKGSSLSPTLARSLAFSI